MTHLKSVDELYAAYGESRLEENDRHFLQHMFHNALKMHNIIFDARKLLDGAPEDVLHRSTYRSLLTSMFVEASGVRGWAENCRQIDYVPASQEEFEAVLSKVGELRVYVQTYIDLCSYLALPEEYAKAKDQMSYLRDIIDGLLEVIDKEITGRYS